jgi:hypothetical protein
MKVRYRQTGGFTGVTLGCELDTEKMPPSEAQELARVVKQTEPDKVGVKTSPRGRDLTNYEIVVQDGGQTTRIVLDDMTIPSNVQPLLDFLSRRASARPLDD